MSAVDQYGANKIARARARLAEEGAVSAVPLLDPLFPYTVVAPPIQYFSQFVKDDHPTDDLPPMGW
jgi:hypothetical protein